MQDIITKVKGLKSKPVSQEIKKRLKQFESFKNKTNNQWFSELCFCILTANSKALTALAIQKELGQEGFLKLSQNKLSSVIKKNKHRFHNNKSKFIIQARKHKNIKSIITNEAEPRQWLVKNIKGLGFKESSHFLRNVGYTNYAILDRHIINLMCENNMCRRPKNLNKNNYLNMEQIFKDLAKKLNMSCSELDMHMWYLKTDKVLK